MCTEALSSVLSQAQRNGLLSGVRASRNGPRVNYLFFADDSLLFGKATKTECERVMGFLKRYEEGSGQKVNFDKSAIFFSSKTCEEDKMAAAQILKVNGESCIEKYLGLPPMVGRNHRQAFQPNLSRAAWKKGYKAGAASICHKVDERF